MGLLLSTRRALLGAVAAWTPASVTSGGYSPEHWYRSDSGLWQDAGITAAAADGDVVGRWEDLSANADHTNQAVVAAKPTLQNAAGDLLNGHPVVRFDGADDWLQGPFTTGGALAQPFIVLAVAELDVTVVDDNNSRTLVDGQGGTRMLLRQWSGTIPDCWAIYAANYVQGGNSDSKWNIWTALFNGVASQFWHNGVSEGVGNSGADNAPGITIGADTSGNVGWKGDATEILIYDANLSDADKNQVGAYLGRRYGLTYTNI